MIHQKKLSAFLLHYDLSLELSDFRKRRVAQVALLDVTGRDVPRKLKNVGFPQTTGWLRRLIIMGFWGTIFSGKSMSDNIWNIIWQFDSLEWYISMAHTDSANKPKGLEKAWLTSHTVELVLGGVISNPQLLQKSMSDPGLGDRSESFGGSLLEKQHQRSF